MPAEATTRLRASPQPGPWNLVGMVAAFALLLQALFAIPLALRMTADAMQWLQFDATICTVGMDGGPAATDHRPTHQFPTHQHAQCVVCQAHALPLALLAIVLCVLAVLSRRVATRCPAATAPPWRSDRYHSYHSRAPPIAA